MTFTQSVPAPDPALPAAAAAGPDNLEPHSGLRIRWTFHPDGIWASSSFCSLAGLTAVDGEIRPAELYAKFSAVELDVLAEALTSVRGNGRGVAVEHRLRGRRGTRTMLTRLTTERDGDRAVSAVVGDCYDLSGTLRVGVNPFQEQIAGLQLALQSRDVIGQAKGVLMATLKITADDAFAALVGASQRRNQPLRDVAAEVATTGALPA